MKNRTLLLFSLCAVGDFVLGYIKEHSVGAGVIYIVFGLPFTALLFFLFRAFRKGKDESDASHS